MGKQYYAGLADAMTPMISSGVKSVLKSGRKHRESPHFFTVLVMFILALPGLPIWSGYAMVADTMRMLWTTRKGMEEREEYLYNIKVYLVLFIIGLFMYNYIYNRYFWGFYH